MITVARCSFVFLRARGGPTSVRCAKRLSSWCKPTRGGNQLVGGFSHARIPLAKATVFPRAFCTTRAVALSEQTPLSAEPPPQLSALTYDQKQRRLKVQFSNGAEEAYPFVWLRDNCQCEACFQPTAKSRLLLLRDVDPDVIPQNVQVSQNGELVITWPDSHTSHFSSAWLWDRRFKEDGQKKRHEFRQLTPKYWGGEMLEKLPKLEFTDIVNTDRGLYNWLVALEVYGICLIQNTPLKRGQVELLASRVGFPRDTHYGPYWDVNIKPDPSNVAYTGADLGLHNDMPYYDNTPGMEMFHFIKQPSTPGGDNEFADSFHVAEELRASDPEAFRMLCTAHLDYSDIGSDYITFHKISNRPIISLDNKGEIAAVNYSNITRDSHMCLPLDDIQPLYAAMRKYDDLLHHPKNRIQIKVQPGGIICFHNYRVLHGRVAFKIVEGFERHMEGGYIDWDELRSRRRVLQGQHNFTDTY